MTLASLLKSPRDEHLETFARYLFMEWATACWNRSLAVDCTSTPWVDLEERQREVWRTLARKARLYVCTNTLLSAN